MISLRTLTFLATSPLLGAVLATENNAISKHQGNSSTVQWGTCDSSVITNPAIICGTLEVPLDYHNRFAGKANIAFARLNATGERRGTVFLLPGGPGGSGIEQLNESGDLHCAREKSWR